MSVSGLKTLGGLLRCLLVLACTQANGGTTHPRLTSRPLARVWCIVSQILLWVGAPASLAYGVSCAACPIETPDVIGVGVRTTKVWWQVRDSDILRRLYWVSFDYTLSNLLTHMQSEGVFMLLGK